MGDNRAAIDGIAQRFAAALGDEITELQRVQINRAAELSALASRLRGRAVNGDGIDLGELVRIEALADEAIGKLSLPAAPSKPPAALEVTFVDPRLSKLTDQQLADLEALVAHLVLLSQNDSSKSR